VQRNRFRYKPRSKLLTGTPNGQIFFGCHDIIHRSFIGMFLIILNAKSPRRGIAQRKVGEISHYNSLKFTLRVENKSRGEKKKEKKKKIKKEKTRKCGTRVIIAKVSFTASSRQVINHSSPGIIAVHNAERAWWNNRERNTLHTKERHILQGKSSRKLKNPSP